MVSYNSAGHNSTPADLDDHLGLATDDGLAVPLTVSRLTPTPGWLTQDTFVLQPVSPLSPLTRYAVLSDFANVPCVQNAYSSTAGGPSPYPLCSAGGNAIDGGVIDGGSAGAPSPVAWFTTGAGPDNVPPSLSGGITQTATSESCTGGGCCGPHEGFSVAMQWPMATDDGPVFYELAREGELLRYPHAAVSAQGAFLCSGTKTTNLTLTGAEDFQGQPGSYQVVAIDLAGTTTAPVGRSSPRDLAAPYGLVSMLSCRA